MDRRRFAASATAVAMVFAIIPAAAFARGPGSHAGKAGNGNSAAHRSTPKAAPKVTSPSHGKGQGHESRGSSDVTRTPNTHGGGWTTMPPGQARHGVEPSGSVDATPTPKLTGIANALSRLQANLARMQAQFDAGRRSALPSGLIATIAKFMSWLGSTEPSTSPEPTSTPTPTDTPAPTGTLVPAPVQ